MKICLTATCIMASNGGIMRRGTPAGEMETSADVHMDTLSPESIGMYILIVVTTTVNITVPTLFQQASTTLQSLRLPESSVVECLPKDCNICSLCIYHGITYCVKVSGSPTFRSWDW